MNFIGKVTVSSSTPKSLKQLILEAIDSRFAAKAAADKAAYLSGFNKMISDETFLYPQGGNITICDNFQGSANGTLTGLTLADVNNFGTVLTDGTSKHLQKGISLHNILIVAATNNFLLDVDVMIGEF